MYYLTTIVYHLITIKFFAYHLTTSPSDSLRITSPSSRTIIRFSMYYLTTISDSSCIISPSSDSPSQFVYLYYNDNFLVWLL
jgi:hypothetical protein